MIISFSIYFTACRGFYDIFFTVLSIFSRGSRACVSTSWEKNKVDTIRSRHTKRVLPILSCALRMLVAEISKMAVEL